MDNARRILVARLTATIDRLTEEMVTQLLELSDDELFALLHGIADEETSAELPPTTPKEQMPHESICISFEVRGQKFDAVGFLREGEESVLGEEALKRADNGHLVRSDADWQLLYQNRRQLPTELRQYWLATARPDPDDPRFVSSLDFGRVGWYDDWNDLVRRWEQGCLVVRRRVSSPV